MKKIIFILILFAGYAESNLFGQAPDIEWQNTIGGSDDDEIFTAEQTDDGGYILGGTSLSGISADKTEASLGWDYWLVKIDAAGEIEWQNTMGGTEFDYLYSVHQTVDGGYILGGQSYSGIGGDKSESHMGDGDIWIVKVNSIGEIEWENTIGGALYENMYSLQVTSDGGYILGAMSASGISGDKTEESNGVTDYWVVKLDVDGNIEWQNSIGGAGTDQLFYIEQTSDFGYILTGSSASGVGGDKTETILGGKDYWVVKLNSSGSIEWQNTIGGAADDKSYAIHQTPDGGYIVGGFSISDLSGDKTENGNGGEDYWVLKLNDIGNIEWQNTIGGNGDDELFSAIPTIDGGYLISGTSDSEMSGDKEEENFGEYDYWVVKLFPDGSIHWQNTIGGTGDDILYFSALQSDDEGYLLGGYSTSDSGIDKTEDALGSYDYWILKLYGDECVPVTYYADTDGDDFGDLNNSIDTCFLIAGYVSNALDCDDSDASIYPGATELPDGIDNNCNDTIDEGLVEILNVLEGNHFNIYPNPAINNFIIELTTTLTENLNVEIYNYAGQVIYIKEIQHSITNIEMDDIASGIYFIRVGNHNSYSEKKLIIE
ncbi:MAG: T9SS type A sorting domain-containing protein [Chitinophagales bacterium]|jgi:hypothetical protein|nr:T9SS type A sorting domain-containing protein [Chitinophagales bacterium]MBP9796466.1 T9SS type A sorting domain-containing protein [Chitinophagales bacterium]